MDSKKQTILIIEDEADNRELLEEILGEEYYVKAVSSGEAGLEVLRKDVDKISVVLLDIRMPNMDGYEFLEIMMADSSISFVPVIVITGEDRDVAEERCLELGAIDFISKPYNSRLVKSRVKTLVRMNETSRALKDLETDELTGLYTKQAFLRRASEKVDANPDKEFGILAFDVENFKLTNSQYGEAKCDEFLGYLGRVIKTYQSDSIICGHFGGDQYVVLFEVREGVNPLPDEKTENEILSNGPIPHQIINKGVYMPINKSVPIVRCCDRAFLAIREIKGVYGVNLSYYDDRIRVQLEEERELTDAMETALLEEQFKVFYQPKHDSMSGKVSGAEALIRWDHPEWGFMSPGKFIPLFERNGFITKIDSFVVERVCKDIKNWINEGMEVVPVSINVSRRDYYEEGWLDSQMAKIDEIGIDHELIHIEVTESLYAENTDMILEQVKKVREKDIMIEMDDFGAGYSSLGMLATFTFDLIKLDISFVRKIEVNKVVIESVINLAHRMGFKTIAEGVETEEQYRTLKELGCDYIQGFFFSKPLSEKEYVEYLRKEMHS